MKEKLKNRNKGITLIALIITIIVMLIIVAASISVAINSGLFEKAGEATGEWKLSQEEENNLKVNIAGTEYNTMEEYVGTLNETGIPWIYEQNEDGEMEITGIDFRKCSVETDDELFYYEYLELGVETLIIPDQLEGKNVVKVTMGESLFPKTLELMAWGVKDVKTIVVGDYVEELDFGQGEWTGYGFVTQAGCFPEITDIQFSDSVLKIGQDSFKGCRNLSVLDLSETKITEIPEEFLLACANDMKNISLPPSVTSISSENPFTCGGQSLDELSFPNGINESLIIPEDKWGASKITIEGVEYVPEAT